MPCVKIKNGIICFPSRRRFRYKKEYYFVEEGGWGRGICDNDGNGLFIEDFRKRKRSKFYKEIHRGVKV